MPSQSSNPRGLELPVPDDDARLHSERLIEVISDRIAQQGGVISFEEYMRMALYQPGLGYYSAATPKFGAEGDFVTAPEISELFGFCIARQAEQLIEQGCAAEVLEFGAGSGKLCAQIMQALPRLQRYRILDLSAELKQRQQRYLQKKLTPQQFSRIEWLHSLPPDFDGIVLANEVLDAMPVHLLTKQPDWIELGVACRGQGFTWQALDDAAATIEAMRGIEKRCGELPDGYRTELNLNYQPWMMVMSRRSTTMRHAAPAR